VQAEPGPLLFARYAQPPNALGHCGGDEPRSLLEHVREGVVDPDLIRLEREFEGAYPYLSLIARENGIGDPLDRRVVEAYWVGNDLLRGVRDGAFADDLAARFGSRASRGERPWLLEAPRRGLPIQHNVHVLSVMPRIGLLRVGLVPTIVEALGGCLVRPGRVEAVRPDGLTVVARRLELRDGRLHLGEPIREEVARTTDGVQPGDWVAIHWGVACDRLETPGRHALARITGRAIEVAAATT
jgi:hypothetical protein